MEVPAALLNWGHAGRGAHAEGATSRLVGQLWGAAAVRFLALQVPLPLLSCGDRSGTPGEVEGRDGKVAVSQRAGHLAPFGKSGQKRWDACPVRYTC